MLRPSSTSILGSTRAERRRNLRREKMRAVGQTARTVGLFGTGLTVFLLGLVLPWALPIVYLGGSFLAVVLPLRWATGHAPLSPLGFGEWLLAIGVVALGAIRAGRRSEPLAPVRPEFARVLLFSAWGAALVLALADLAS